ncbi:MAG: hypothetical protein RL040_948, partial [Bacteroidota bacterium]
MRRHATTNSTAGCSDGSCYYVGGSCNDNNEATLIDLWNASCECEGVTDTIGKLHTCGAANVHNPNLTYGSMTDQEGNVYKTIVIGTQEWMAENLNTSIYRNGDVIVANLDEGEWYNTYLTNTGSWVYYNNDPTFECPYGKLYNHYATVDSRGLCPSGWQLPSIDEYETLVLFLEPSWNGSSSFTAGGDLKSIGNIQD